MLGFDFQKYRPLLFLIESAFPRTILPSYSSWEYILIKNNYSFVYQYSVNRFYVDNSNTFLKSKFLNIDKYLKTYESLKSKKN